MNDVEEKIKELTDLKTSLLNKSASLDSSLLSMDEYLIANLRKKIVETVKKIDIGLIELNGYLKIMKDNKKWD